MQSRPLHTPLTWPGPGRGKGAKGLGWLPLLLQLGAVLSGNRCLGGRQAGDGDAVGGTGNVVEPSAVAEGNAFRVAAMFAANAEFQVWSGGTAALAAQFYQFTDAVLIEADKRIALYDALFLIGI